jgi:hypothetical protein
MTQPTRQRADPDQENCDRSALSLTTQMMAAGVHEKSRRTCSADISILFNSMMRRVVVAGRRRRTWKRDLTVPAVTSVYRLPPLECAAPCASLGMTGTASPPVAAWPGASAVQGETCTSLPGSGEIDRANAQGDAGARGPHGRGAGPCRGQVALAGPAGRRVPAGAAGRGTGAGPSHHK